MEADAVFEYNGRKKWFFGVLAITAGFLITIFIGLYIFHFREMDIALFRVLNLITQHITSHIGSGSLLGVSYVSFLGGLFFVVIPMEVAFINFLRLGTNPFLLVIIYLAGHLISYTINYALGKQLSGLTKKIVTAKRFYELKSMLNKWGAWAIFFINVVPLPSQALSAILGVFKYNRTRFYIFFLSGQIVKYTIIAVAIGFFV